MYRDQRNLLMPVRWEGTADSQSHHQEISSSSNSLKERHGVLTRISVIVKIKEILMTTHRGYLLRTGAWKIKSQIGNRRDLSSTMNKSVIPYRVKEILLK